MRTHAAWPLFIVAAAILTGCQQSQPSIGLPPGAVDPSPLLAKIPAELRHRPKPEDTAAQDRYVRACRLAAKDSAAQEGANRGANQLPCMPSTLVELRKILKEGPVELGYDELLDEQGMGYPSFRTPDVGTLLAAAGTVEIRSGQKAEGIEDIILSIKWNRQVSDPLAEFGPISFEMTRQAQEAFMLAGLTRADRLKILAAYPSDSELAEMQREQIKLALEDRVYALAALQAPRKDLLIGRIGVAYGFGGAIRTRPDRSPIAVPPHGTLNREETLDGLIKLAQLAYDQADASLPTGYTAQPPMLTELVKWVPRLPAGLRTNSAKERHAVEKKVKAYVEEMNKGENTLGRQFLQSGLQIASGRIAQLRQTVQHLRASLDQTPPKVVSRNPQPKPK